MAPDTLDEVFGEDEVKAFAEIIRPTRFDRHQLFRVRKVINDFFCARLEEAVKDEDDMREKLRAEDLSESDRERFQALLEYAVSRKKTNYPMRRAALARQELAVRAVGEGIDYMNRLAVEAEAIVAEPVTEE